MKIPAFVTVRTSSQRLPGKCLLPFGESNVLEHVIRRIIHYGLDPIVCTTVEHSDDIVEKIAGNEKAKYFRGSVRHKLKRWRDCCDKFGIEKFHTVDADDPFFDGELVKKSFAMLEEGYNAVYPSESSSAGGASVGFSLTREIIARACDMTEEDEDTEMMWYYLEKVPGFKKTELPEENSNSPHMRLTLDYKEDYWMLRTIQRIVGNLASRRDIDKLFESNPDFHKINWFRNFEWKQEQLSKKV